MVMNKCAWPIITFSLLEIVVLEPSHESCNDVEDFIKLSQILDTAIQPKSLEKYRSTNTECELANYFSGGKDPVVLTKNGNVKGRLVSSPSGPRVEQFLGIPFAKPPTGERRYAKPEPIESFSSDPYPAFDYGYTCPGYIDTTYGDFQGSDMWNAKTGLSEDCLYLNIWAPKHKKEEKLAVMVCII